MTIMLSYKYWAQAIITFFCVNSTPFGCPVVPDEYNMRVTASAMFCERHWNFATFVITVESRTKLLKSKTFDGYLKFGWLKQTIVSIQAFCSATLTTLLIVLGSANIILGFERLTAWLSSPEIIENRFDFVTLRYTHNMVGTYVPCMWHSSEKVWLQRKMFQIGHRQIRTDYLHIFRSHRSIWCSAQLGNLLLEC